jgi:hypothetical protein
VQPPVEQALLDLIEQTVLAQQIAGLLVVGH